MGCFFGIYLAVDPGEKLKRSPEYSEIFILPENCLSVLGECMKQTIIRYFAILIGLFAFPLTAAIASIQCYNCHGTSVPVDNRPLDASHRNISSGGFRGSHRTHMNSQAAPAACETCHPGSSTYASAHRDGVIKVSSRINGSPLTTPYKNNTSTFIQTGTPALGSCSNVNCHFEKITPIWGSDPSTTTCTTCHGVPPSGDMNGAAGSHSRHVQYFTGIVNCQKCHANNTNFQHATSAGNRNLRVNFVAAPNNGSGAYSGPLNDYLPSQANIFGSCSNTYCHSNGTSVATTVISANTSLVWGSGAMACNGCHGSPPTYVTDSPKANSHAKHVFSCGSCHAGTTADGTSITDVTRHVNGAYDLVPGSGASFNYSFAHTGGTCSTISCHGNNSATWGSTVACGSCHDVPPANGAHLAHTDGAGARYDSDAKNSVAAAYRFNCGNCHPMDLAKHGNGLVDIELYNSAATGFKSNNTAGAGRTGTGNATVCLNIYCHSSGQNAGIRIYSATPAWGGSFVGNRCAGCHGDPPTYASGGSGSTNANSHYSRSYTETMYGWQTVDSGHLIGLHFDNIKKDPPDQNDHLIPRSGPVGSGAAHGDSGTSTTISCPTCHAATVTVFSQLSAPGTVFDCTACHSAPTTGSIADKSRHVNGTRDVVFMAGDFRSKAQLRLTSFTSAVKPLGWTRNNGYKASNSYDSVPFSGSYNPAEKSCVTACHLNQPVQWGDTNFNCFGCHADL